MTPWTAALQTFLPITNSWSLLKLMSIESVRPFNHLILYHPLFLLPLIFPSIRVFSSEPFFSSGGQSIGVSASASILPMNIQDWFPLGIDWLDLLAVQGTLKNSPTHFKSLKSLVLSFLCSPALTSVHDYWKNHSFDYTNLCQPSNVSAF